MEKLISKEGQRILKCGIFPIRHSTRVSNIVPVSKKNGEIRFFIDLMDLNRHAIRHHSPLPMTDGPLTSVNGSEVMFM